jgi:hypothetical protein
MDIMIEEGFFKQHESIFKEKFNTKLSSGSAVEDDVIVDFNNDFRKIYSKTFEQENYLKQNTE